MLLLVKDVLTSEILLQIFDIMNHTVRVSHNYVIELNENKYIIILWTNTYELHSEVPDFDSLELHTVIPIKLIFLYCKIRPLYMNILDVTYCISPLICFLTNKMNTEHRSCFFSMMTFLLTLFSVDTVDIKSCLLGET
jgi:hypothetical protein